MKNYNLILAMILSFAINLAYSQATIAPGNFWTGPPAYLGWDNASPTPLLIQHQTPNQPMRFLNFDNNVAGGVVAPKMELTVGGAMIDDLGVPLPNDGLRIWNPGYPGSFGFPGAGGALDIWTGDNNTTHMRFDGGGSIHTQSNRMEIIGKRNGLWLNAAPDFNFPALNARIFFNIGTVAGGGNEYGRFSNDGTGNNIGFLRIGVQPAPGTPIDAARRLEVFDAATAPQFRITETAGTNFTDFQSTFRGDLYIHPVAAGVNRRVGINRDDPRTTLEINSNGNIVTNPRSGLQFTDMTNASPHSATNGGVLSLDANGEVIFVDDIGGGNISSSCGSLSTNYINKVSGSSSICTSGIYEDNALNVGIGTTSSLLSKVNIKKTVTSGWVSGLYIETDGITGVTGCYSKQSSGTITTSFFSEIDNPGSGSDNKSYYSGITGTSNSTNTGFRTTLLHSTGTTANTVTNFGFRANIGASVQSYYSYGFFAQSYYANHNYGVWVDAIPTPGINVDALSCGGHFDGGTSNSGTSVVEACGVVTYAHGGSTANYGVKGRCNSSAADNYAIYGEVLQPNSGVNNYAGYFVGNVYAIGSITSSDLKLKTNILPLNNGLNIISQLKPKYYDYLTAQFPTMNLPNDNHAGLIAQDLELVLPALVKSARQPAVVDSNGIILQPEVDFKGVNYPELIPYLIAAVQEQQHQIDSLANLISNGNPIQPKLQNQNTIEVELSNQNKIILNQNDPNPFAENTTINYFIPESVNAAQLLFYDNSGTILKTVDIKEKGQGSVLIYGSNLSSGVYTYTLLADGKVMETKRMVKVK